MLARSCRQSSFCWCWCAAFGPVKFIFFDVFQRTYSLGNEGGAETIQVIGRWPTQKILRANQTGSTIEANGTEARSSWPGLDYWTMPTFPQNPYDPTVPLQCRTWEISYLITAILSVPYPAWLIASGLRRRTVIRNRLALNLCAECGYDIRTNRGNCPECGVTLCPHPPPCGKA